MITDYNQETFNKIINAYLDIVTRVNSNTTDARINQDPALDANPRDVLGCYTEALYRFVAKQLLRNGMIGPSDVTLLELVPFKDFNTQSVAWALKQTIRARQRELFSQMLYETAQRACQAFPKPLSDVEYSRVDIACLYLQERIGLILFQEYLGNAWDFGLPYDPVFNPNRLRTWVISDWHGPDGKDWKSMRCHIYRYLLYCGFVDVNDDCSINKQYVPDVPTLTRLTDRCIDIMGLRRCWPDSKLNMPMGEVLNPEAIAKHFLRFNGLID